MIALGAVVGALLLLVAWLWRRLRRLESRQASADKAISTVGEVLAEVVAGTAPPQTTPRHHRRQQRHLRALPAVLAPAALWVAHQARHRPALAATGAAVTLAAGVATVPLLLGPEPSTGQLDLAPPPPPAWTVPAEDPAPSPDPDTSPPLNGHPTTPPEPVPEVPAPTPRPGSSLDADPTAEPPGDAGDGGSGGELVEPEPEPTQPPQTTPPAEPSPEPADPEPEADSLLCVAVGLPPLLDANVCLL